VKKIDAYECPNCHYLYNESDDAEDCCPHEVVKTIAYRCECGEIYDQKSNADQCCEINYD